MKTLIPLFMGVVAVPFCTAASVAFVLAAVFAGHVLLYGQADGQLTAMAIAAVVLSGLALLSSFWALNRGSGTTAKLQRRSYHGRVIGEATAATRHYDLTGTLWSSRLAGRR